jgi:nucleosome binding factor SPN SPT16 subunit
VQTAARLTSTLLKYHVAPKLESILDKEAKISHDTFAAQIEARLGSGEGSLAKGPDMKVWNRGKGLDDVGVPYHAGVILALTRPFCCRLTGNWLNFVIRPSLFLDRASLDKSGYDLRYTVESSNDNIAHKGVFLVAFGLRYKSYCANVGRTFIVDPNPVSHR